MNTVLLTVLVLSILGLILALVLYFVAQKFKVEEDPRIDGVQEILPGANCGGCGDAGCRAFAEDCVKAESLDSLFCPVGGNETMKKVAEYLGRTVEEKAPRIAVIRCNGTCGSRPTTTIYDGYASCGVMAALYTGESECRWGCLGGGDCVAACKFDAIKMDSATGLPVVDDEKCTACGACVKACPKAIIELRNKGPKNRRIFVSCVNKDKGGIARKACGVACIGCGKCQKICPFDAITINNFLAYIDPDKCKLCRKCVAECPTTAIHEINFPARLPKKEEAITVEQ